MNNIEKALEYLKYPIGHTYEEYEEYEKVAINALEKQVPKKPVFRLNGDYWCPECGHGIKADGYRSKYCPECGQALDWSNKDE